MAQHVSLLSQMSGKCTHEVTCLVAHLGGVIESSSPSSGLGALEAVVSFENNTVKPRLHPGTRKLGLLCVLKSWPFFKHPGDPTPQVAVLPLANFI